MSKIVYSAADDTTTDAWTLVEGTPASGDKLYAEDEGGFPAIRLQLGPDDKLYRLNTVETLQPPFAILARVKSSSNILENSVVFNYKGGSPYTFLASGFEHAHARFWSFVGTEKTMVAGEINVVSDSAAWCWMSIVATDEGGGNVRYRINRWEGEASDKPEVDQIDVTTDEFIADGLVGIYGNREDSTFNRVWVNYYEVNTSGTQLDGPSGGEAAPQIAFTEGTPDTRLRDRDGLLITAADVPIRVSTQRDPRGAPALTGAPVTMSITDGEATLDLSAADPMPATGDAIYVEVFDQKATPEDDISRRYVLRMQDGATAGE